MSGQPSSPGFWVFDVAAEAVETGLGVIQPSIVVNNGANNLAFRTTISNGDGTTQDAGVSQGINGTAGRIRYFATQLDAAAPATVALGSTPFTMTAPHPQQVVSGTFSTNGGAGNLNIGVWLVTVVVDFPGTSQANVAAGFTQILLIVI
jgi:hypothetical protein